jgi:hypothetical protein
MSAMKNNALVLCALIGGGVGCMGSSGGSNDSAKMDAGYRPSSTGGFAMGIPASGAGGGGGTMSTTATTPPEQETKVDYMTPRGGDQRVYIANPTRNTVTIINSNGPTITERTTGDTPTYVATIPGKDVALVINAGSHTLSVIRGDGDAGDAPSYPIVARANAIAISPDGTHAVVWFDSSQPSSNLSSFGSTQEVCVVNLGATSDKVYAISVGYNPSAVVFASDSSAAFVVTDDGISELRFASITGPGIAPFTRIDDGSLTLVGPDAGAGGKPDSLAPADLAVVIHAPPGVLDGGVATVDGGEVPDGDGARPDAIVDLGRVVDFGRDSGNNAGKEAGADATAVGPDSAPVADAAPTVAKGKAVDVSVTKAGDYAVARRQGTGALLLVDIKAKTVSTLMLSSEVTDLDLADTPSGPQAFAVLRSESVLVRIDVPAGFTDETHRKRWPFEGSMIGSVTLSAKGTYALLYTTAVASTDLAVFDLVSERIAPTPAVKRTIRAVAVAPDEKTALVLHPKSASSGTSTSPDDQSYGYSMINLTTGFTKLITTPADPNPFVITPDSSNAFVLLRDDKAPTRAVQRIALDSFVTADFSLGSPPSSIAALSTATKKVFVGQVYPEGRISFINWETDVVQTVTGFALNGRIQQ